MNGLDPVATFRQEAGELLETLEQTLLDLGQQPGDGDLVNRAFRALHTIKGSGAMFGFTALAAFVHDFETAFDRVRKGEAPASDDLVNVALQARDHIAWLMERPEAGHHEGDAILERLRAVVQGGAAEAAAPAARASQSRSRPGPVRRRLPAGASASGCPRTRWCWAPTRSCCSTSCAGSAPASCAPSSATCPRSR